MDRQAEGGEETEARVLVVDDHDELRTAICETLEAEGYGCDQAAAGGLALERLLEGRYDALVLDLRLPDMSGFDILERLSRQGVVPPTVIVSVFDDDESRRRAAALGAIGFHQKPFSPEALVEDVRRALASSPSTASS